MSDSSDKSPAAISLADALDEAVAVIPADDNGPLARVAWTRNDMGNAERLIAIAGEDMTYVPGVGWFVWDSKRHARGSRVRDDQSPQAIRKVHQMVRAIEDEATALRDWLAEDRARLEADGAFATPADLAKRVKRDVDLVIDHRKWMVSSGNSAKVKGALDQARPYLTRDADDLDADPWLLTIQNGTLDLRPDLRPGWVTPAYNGCSDRPPPAARLRAHARTDRITCLADVVYDAAATCPKWLRFIERVQPDPEIRDYLQRLAGYTLTGDVGEQVFAIHYGGGKNGKSTFVMVLQGLMGDYAKAVNPKVFMAGDERDDGTRANSGLAKLRATRFVSASEPSEDAKLGESLIKAVTGSGKMPVRDLFETEIEVLPRWKLWFDTNFKPNIRGLDYGIWRRIHAVPWRATIPEADRIKDFHLVLLAEEAPGILNWLLEGVRLWLDGGLDPPPAVLDAVEEYQRESDPLYDFLDASTTAAPGRRGPAATELYTTYCWWCAQNAKTPMNNNSFGRRMTKRGTPSKKVEGINHYPDIEILLMAKPPEGWAPGDAKSGKGRQQGHLDM